MIGSSNLCILLPALTSDDLDTGRSRVVERRAIKTQPRSVVPELGHTLPHSSRIFSRGS